MAEAVVAVVVADAGDGAEAGAVEEDKAERRVVSAKRARPKRIATPSIGKREARNRVARYVASRPDSRRRREYVNWA